ncbi:L-arabinose transport system permease protein AraH [Pararobbsia alpina]|uniref:ABC transporter permease n=1 Tax=Pararobbsia alpina TaxID=621374 RepID=UPI0039A5FCCD
MTHPSSVVLTPDQNPRAARPARRRSPLRDAWLPITLVGLSAAVYAAAAIYTGQFAQLSFGGIMGLLQRMVALGLVAIGQNFVIIAGSIDLSVANLISVCAVMASYLMQGDAHAIVYGVVLTLVIAALVGAVNGLLVTRLSVSPLIATLGVGMVLQGVLSVAFTTLRGAVPKSFQTIAYGSVVQIPYAVLLLAAALGIAGYVLTRTVSGARLYTVGGNAHSARLAGIRTARVMIGAHVIGSLMAGIGGLYLASWLGAGTPWVGRDGGYGLDSIAVIVIGGTLLAGGRGGVAGTIAGVFVFATLDAVFNMLQIDPFLSQVLRGAIVILAVGAYTFRHKGHVA